MRILADLHISPRTVEFLRGLGYEAARISQALDPRAADAEIAAHARTEGYVILSQDLISQRSSHCPDMRRPLV